MESTREQSESADILPRPELNPLLNPILSDNMGRWAEVYFTSPPEKREEAVIELLQELGKERERAETHPEPDTNLKRSARQVHFEPRIVEERQSEQRFCGMCGSENPATHQFCGMCGAKLYLDSSAPESPSYEHAAAEHAPAPPRIVFARESAPERVRAEESYEQGAYEDTGISRHTPTFHAPAAGSDELSLFQSFRSQEADEEWDYEPPPSTSYRFYIAAVLLIVIGALGYMAWRGAQTSQSSHEVSPPPPAPVTESAQPAAPAQQASSAPQTTAPTQQTAAPKSEPEAAAAPTPAPVPVNTVASPKKRVPEREVAEKTPQPVSTDQAGSQQVSSLGGAEELAMAERYLNGSTGHGRNSSEAAAWLWKSIAKHNGQATILLSELYLRGDGVSKNCEQGRVLLDSAARRGIPGAGDRLRNLQAFGCH